MERYHTVGLNIIGRTFMQGNENLFFSMIKEAGETLIRNVLVQYFQSCLSLVLLYCKKHSTELKDMHITEVHKKVNR